MEKTLSSDAPEIVHHLGPEAGMQPVMAKMPPHTNLYQTFIF